MPRINEWTQEEYEYYKQQIIPLLKKKVSIKIISEKFKISFYKIYKILDAEGLKGPRRVYHKWTKERYKQLYEQSIPYLRKGYTIKTVAKIFKVYPYRIKEAINLFKSEKDIDKASDSKQIEICEDLNGHSIEFDSKMNWRKFKVEIRLLSCPIDKFKVRVITCSAIQEIQEYFEQFCPLNELILQFGDNNKEMFVYINDIKRPLDEQTIHKLFY